ncbi:MAG: DUF1634 domain-containing protein [Methanomassiliicoccales archaeon]|nr:DUF1634 domain-containing protein [Methanomassiliicoccales archaeon]
MAQSSLNKNVRYVLLAGMATSLTMMLIGLIAYALNPSSPDIALDPIEAIRQLLKGNPVGLLSLGIMLLIITPFARILVALAEFAKGKEWRMVVVSLVVITIVAVAIVVGAA